MKRKLISVQSGFENVSALPPGCIVIGYSKELELCGQKLYHQNVFLLNSRIVKYLVKNM